MVLALHIYNLLQVYESVQFHIIIFIIISYWSLRDIKVKPDILISIDGSSPGPSLHFQKYDNISDEEDQRVLGPHSSATMSCTLYPNANDI